MRCVRRGLLAVGILGVLSLVWAVLIEPRWVAARTIDMQVQGWAGPEGLKVVVASDWHFTKRALWRVTTVDRARSIVQDINAAKPDVILLPGDFLADRNYRGDDGGPAEDEIAEVLGELKAPYGVYAVLGNHEWWHDGAKFAAALRRNGIQVLENESKAIPGLPLWLVGVGDDSTGHSYPLKAVAKLPAGQQALVMMHDPTSFLSLPPVQGLVVAGHTHGGQVYLPWVGALIVPGAAPREWAYGWINYHGNRMYVTSGIGVSILPVRFNMRPEWVLFRIK